MAATRFGVLGPTKDGHLIQTATVLVHQGRALTEAVGLGHLLELPQNADPDKVQARYTNGCLSITVGKRETSKPRAINVQ